MRILLSVIAICGFIGMLCFAGCRPQAVSVEATVARAEALLEAGRPDEALELLDGLLLAGQERVDVLETMAFAYAQIQEPTMAALTFVRIAELVPERPEYLIYAANALVEADDPRGASARYRDYLAVRPDDRAVWVSLAELELGFGRTRQALDAFLRAEQIGARTQQQLAIAALYLQLNNLAQAQAWYGQAVNGDESLRAQALLGLLETAVRGRRFDDAAVLLAKLDSDFPGAVDTSAIAPVRGQLQEWQARQAEVAAAAAALERRQPAAALPLVTLDTQSAAAEEPDAVEEPAAVEVAGQETVAQQIPAPAPVATEPLVVLDSAARDPGAQADAAAPAVPASAPVSAAGLRQSALRQVAAGDLATAIRQFRQSLVLDDRPAMVWTELSRAQLEAGDARAAHASASEAVRRAPDEPVHTVQLLRAAGESLESTRLLREMENAYRRFPGDPDIVLVLARLFENLGNRRNALLLYEEFLDLAPIEHPRYAEVQAIVRGGNP